MAQKPAYKVKLDQLDLDVPDDLAKRYRVFLLNPSATIPYLTIRMDPLRPDIAWMDKVSRGSDARETMEAEGVEHGDIMARAIEEGREVLSQGNERKILERLAYWLDNWLGPKGKTSFRNSINARLHYLRKRREVIGIHPDTMGRLLDLENKIDGVETYDDAIRYLMAHYEETAGVKLEDISRP